MNILGKSSGKKRIDFLRQEDFELIKKHYTDKTEELLSKSDISDNETALDVAREAFYLQCFIDDMVFFGYENISKSLLESLGTKFSDPLILRKISSQNLQKAIKEDGLKTIGENDYVLLEGKIFYKTLKGKWYEIENDQAFFLLPKLSKEISNQNIIERLDKYHKPDRAQRVYDYWKNHFKGENLQDLLLFKDGVTTPEEYFKESSKQIKKIIDSPVSIDLLDQSHHEDEHYLEAVIKVSCKLVDFVKGILSSSRTSLYLLRDGIMFAEAQRALDCVSGKKSLNSQVMINRKLLSRENGDEYYWSLSADALYAALSKESSDFDVFYHDYCLEMEKIEQSDKKFSLILDNLSNYVSLQLSSVLQDSDKILVVDTGLQGSINMLTKYLLDKHSKIDKPVDIKMFVVGDWLKGVYEGKYASEYYPMMKDIEIFNRSEHLYKYKAGSFEAGKLEVEMGSRDKQLLANIELIILVTVCAIMGE